ncbi:Serine/threonine-protein kinase shk2 [Gracilariopsis chorda]|uniref:Serine/threonine-protein kinase shk2 n=1 Tax=Gracilariopsis chorda TaxID=448386 RepID=A0A2V3ICF3_9FLOR|nr:Serine/threonine-protein kinase shk2 [Gracilariopsis chorda]|eukprot:PXF39769.1 Serine/threonine-protein kinase shk2 [Gracilariopsis chorda]
MKLLKTEFIYELGEEGVVKFSFTAVLYTDQEKVFVTTIPRRVYDSDLQSLYLHALNGREIDRNDIYPRFDVDSFTNVSVSPRDKVYIKRPNVMMYTCEESEEDTQLWKVMREEAKVCEILRQSPHPNIAKYLGCEVKDGYIVGLCFERYSETLRERVDGCPRKVDRASCIQSVKKGIQHLHALGFCHNDISPDNVMFDGCNTPVLIDFDSCRREGEPLGSKTGTLGFSRTGIVTSEVENDIFALQKLEEYLNVINDPCGKQ